MNDYMKPTIYCEQCKQHYKDIRKHKTTAKHLTNTLSQANNARIFVTIKKNGDKRKFDIIEIESDESISTNDLPCDEA